MDLTPPVLLRYRRYERNAAIHEYLKTRRRWTRKAVIVLRASMPPPPCAGQLDILHAWDVGVDDARVALGAPAARPTSQGGGGGASVSPPTPYRRIGYSAGIYKILQVLHSDPHLADTRVHRRKTASGGQAPLQRMAACDVTDLTAVRGYFHAARPGAEHGAPSAVWPKVRRRERLSS